MTTEATIDTRHALLLLPWLPSLVRLSPADCVLVESLHQATARAMNELVNSTWAARCNLCGTWGPRCSTPKATPPTCCHGPRTVYRLSGDNARDINGDPPLAPHRYGQPIDGDEMLEARAYLGRVADGRAAPPTGDDGLPF